MDGAGWAVGADRTAVTPTLAAFSQPGTQTGTGPAGAVRHPVRAVHRDSVGVPAAGVGVRLRDDLLAPVGPVAPGRGLATPARAAAGRTQRRGQVGLVQGGDRRLACAGLERRPKTGPSPVDRAKTGSKHHVITEGAGIPLAVTLTGGNRHDVTQLLPLIQAIPSVRGKRGRPRRRPDSLYADRAYDYDIYRDQVSGKGITPPLCPTRCRTRLRSGCSSLGSGTDGRAAALVPSSAHPLGDPRRHPRSLHEPGLLHHLLPPTRQMIILLKIFRFLGEVGQRRRPVWSRKL